MGTLADQLKLFTSNEDQLAIPFVDSEPDTIVEETVEDDAKSLKMMTELIHNRSKKKSDESEGTNAHLKYLSEEDLSDDFDFLVDSFDEDEEDITLRHSLTEMGRKYARETSIMGESSEVQKIFSGSEKRINGLIQEIRHDKESIDKDIAHLTSMRTRNVKVLGELREIKNEYHNAELSAIKELNNITVKKYDLQLKAKAAQKESADAASANGNLISSLFSLGRKNVVGGYAQVSGASNRDYSAETDNDDYGTDGYVPEETENESDGDKFLKYRDAGVHYVLMVDDHNEPQGVIAEDKDGNIISDYPMPTASDDMIYEIDNKLGIATDVYHNEYQLRRV